MTRHAAFLWSLLLPVSISAQVGESHPTSSHGTVNVILANAEGLVAVTDSRLTDGNGNHVDTGRKLFKIDDKTICTMAGRYQSPTREKALTLDVPNVIDSVTKLLRTSPLPNLSAKLDLLSRLLQIALQTNAIASHAFGEEPDLSQPVALTMAGYDNDNKLKVSSILLRIQDAEHNYEVKRDAISSTDTVCGFQLSSYQGYTETVHDTFCRLAGEPKYAYLFMTSPASYSGTDQTLLDFSKSLNARTFAELSIGELQMLAKGLEEETAMKSPVVGGAAQIATLQAGKVSLFPSSNLDRAQQGRLVKLVVRADIHGYVSSSLFSSTSSTSLVISDSYFENSRYKIDGVVFSKSTFTGMQLVYNGDPHTYFSEDNIVNGSDLLIGPDVRPSDPILKQLMSKFHWRNIYCPPINLDTGRLIQIPSTTPQCQA